MTGVNTEDLSNDIIRLERIAAVVGDHAAALPDVLRDVQEMASPDYIVYVALDKAQLWAYRNTLGLLGVLNDTNEKRRAILEAVTEQAQPLGDDMYAVPAQALHAAAELSLQIVRFVLDKLKQRGFCGQA